MSYPLHHLSFTLFFVFFLPFILLTHYLVDVVVSNLQLNCFEKYHIFDKIF